MSRRSKTDIIVFLDNIMYVDVTLTDNCQYHNKSIDTDNYYQRD